MSPHAHIVIVTYNAGEFVDAAVDSALAQSVPCEVAIVDNASTDGSIARLRAKYPGLHFVESDRNYGYAHAADLGAFLDTGSSPRFVATLNPDAIARPDWIERMTGWMDERRVDVASSVVLGGARAFFAGGTWLPYLGVARTHDVFAGEESHWVSGCAMLVRAEWFSRLGGFDAEYFLYSEDVDLCLRASALGARVGVCSEALVSHPEPGKSSDELGRLRKHRIVMESKGLLVRRFSRGLAVPSALLFQLLVSPALNGAKPGEYPALMRSFLEGFRRAGRVRASL